MRSFSLCMAALLVVVVIFTACVANKSPLTADETPGAVRGSTHPVVDRFPGLPDILRSSTSTSGSFLIQQSGANFAADLPANRCTSDAINANFVPGWTASAGNPLTNAAYCIYRLTYDPLSVPVKLSLNWNGAAPAETDCWIGLSDWTSGAWHWELLPTGGELELASPKRFIDAELHSFVAVVLLGETACSLARIGFGVPVPTGEGYTLDIPLNDTNSYLIDMAGGVAHAWASPYTPGATGELLANGHLLRAANLKNPNYPGGGTAGRMEEYDWDGNLVWSFELNNDTQCTHHDFALLPNGNLLLIVWNHIPEDDIIAAGRDPSTINPGKFYADSVVEVQPIQPSGGVIVWEWRVTDHLIQDFDATKANYGDPALHPELVDVNFPDQTAGDWTHINCVSYNAALDQIMLTTPMLCEVWIIDHSTTAEEAQGHSGGRYGRGGDLLYRWGNPAAYRAGTTDDQQLFGGHDGHWIESGLDGAGEVLVFNNNAGSPEGLYYSSVVQITPPLNPDGSYYMTGKVFGPAEPTWQYVASPPGSFFSMAMSSSQRLPGGDTLICNAGSGLIFVVDPAGTILWQYENQFPSGPFSVVFRALRYTPDYPGLAYLE